MKKFISIFICIVICFTLIGCKKDKVKIVIWHNYGGQMEIAIESLIDEFNRTIGEDKRIHINTAYTGSSSDLQKNLLASANGEPGSLPLPNITIGYPKNAIYYQNKNMLVDFNEYFTTSEIDMYVDAFIEEGTFNNGLYVFPTAKSTEVLFLNRTLLSEGLHDENIDDLITEMSTFEGLLNVASRYHQATNEAFLACDSYFNIFAISAAQSGQTFFEDNKIINSAHTEYLYKLFMENILNGSINVYDGYSSDLSKIGNVACSIGSTAGILFYGNSITYENGIEKEVEFTILPYPTIVNSAAGGERQKISLQRGNGMMAFKSNKDEENAVATFIKYFTSPKQNLEFILSTGYLPVTKESFSRLNENIDKAESNNIKQLLTIAKQMINNYTFYTMPLYENFDSDSTNYEKKLKLSWRNALIEYQKDDNLLSKEEIINKYYTEFIK